MLYVIICQKLLISGRNLLKRRQVLGKFDKTVYFFRNLQYVEKYPEIEKNSLFSYENFEMFGHEVTICVISRLVKFADLWK